MEIYLDHAATSHPKPEAVLLAMRDALTRDNGNPGRSGHRRALAGARAMLSCRESLAKLLGASDPFDIAFAPGCTAALNLGIKGTLRKGDHVLSSLLEHNSVLRVLEGQRLRGRIDLTLIEPQEDGRIDPKQFRAALRPNTKLIVLSHASNVTGVIQPIFEVAKIAQAYGIAFLVDGAQALGAVPVEAEKTGISLYAFAGHKSLLGPQGIGGLYISPKVALDTLVEGGTGSSSESMVQPSERPERFESGTANLPGIAGLLAGANYVLENAESIRKTESSLTAQLLAGLREMDGVHIYCDLGAPRTAVVSFNVGDHTSGAVADALDQSGFCVRGGLHCAPGIHRSLGTLRRGAVRASLGHKNTAAEVDQFLRAVYAITRGG